MSPVIQYQGFFSQDFPFPAGMYLWKGDFVPEVRKSIMNWQNALILPSQMPV